MEKVDSEPADSLTQATHGVFESKSADKETSSDPTRTGSSTTISDSETDVKSSCIESPTPLTSIKSLGRNSGIVPCPPDDSPRGSRLSMLSSGFSSFAKSLKLPQQDSQDGNAGSSNFARFTSGLGLRFPSKAPNSNEAETPDVGAIKSFTTGLVDSSRSAVKAVQVKARHIVSQNKRRYQEGGFDLDMTYITENVIAMGFPAGDLSSGLFGFFEGFYRNHMEEVIRFFETHHQGKYKVYNLCSERLYDASRFEGKVASFPFDDHNCPPVQLIPLFCRSAYSWLKEDIQNVVVVHCKAGMARTGLMICSLLLFLRFFPTAEEAIEYYNQKRCLDGKALVLPSQIRYVKYYEHFLAQFDGDVPPGRRCMLRGFRLINCPYWVRPSITVSNHGGVLFTTRKHPKTKDLMPQDFWLKAQRKGIVVFALPREPGLTEVKGDFKIHFHELQGDFYCWLNTSMIENRLLLNGSELDGFDKRNLPSPGFQVEILMVDCSPKSKTESSKLSPGPPRRKIAEPTTPQVSHGDENDDIFSDSDREESGNSKAKRSLAASTPLCGSINHNPSSPSLENESSKSNDLPTEESSRNSSGVSISSFDSADVSNIKAIAADASVFSFGDEDYESD